MENDSLDSRNRELNKKIGETDLPKAVSVLIADAKKRRRQVRWLTFSIILDLLLTIGLAYNSAQTRNIASQAESNKAALIARCESTNEARAKNEKLWDYLIEQSKGVPRSEKEQKFFDQFITLKDETFAPANCNDLN